MSAALAAEGENLTKLEKADVLELTVRHLHQLHRDGELFFPGSDQPGPSGRASTANSPSSSTDRRRYQGGFLACAQQVASYVMKTPGLEPGVGQRLLAHLAVCSQQIGGPAGSPSSPTSPKAEVLPLPGPSGMVPLFPSAGEYSITAQFQVYPRPATEMSWPSPQPVHPSGSLKRRPEEDSPHILPPKKQRYRSESSSSGCSPAVAENPPRPSSGGAQPSNPPDSKEGDPMWRPW